MVVQLQFRRGNSTAWTAADPTLAEGEMGIELDTNKFKIGDGVTVWSTLAYGGLQGTSGDSGTTDHSLLGNLTYATAGHTGFCPATGSTVYVSGTSTGYAPYTGSTAYVPGQSTDFVPGTSTGYAPFTASTAYVPGQTTDYSSPKRSIFLSLAGGWTSTNLADGGFYTTQTSTEKVYFRGTKFAVSTDDCNHEFGTPLPANFSSASASITGTPYFVTASTDASNHTIIFGLQAVSYPSESTMDTAYGSAAEATFTCSSAIHREVIIGTPTTAITIAGAPMGGEWCQFRTYRKAADTFTGDVTLLGWLVSYNTNNYSDE